MEAEIKAEFEKSGFIVPEEETILNKCLTFCINKKLSPSDLVSSWEVYYLNRQLNESTLKSDDIDVFLFHLQNEMKEAVIKEEPNLHSYTSHDVEMILNYEEEDGKDAMLETPVRRTPMTGQKSSDSVQRTNGSIFPSGKPSDLVTPFGQRTNKFSVQFTINNNNQTDEKRENQETEHDEDDLIRRVQPSKRCSVLVHGLKPEPGCRFMYDRIEDKFNSLESRIKKHASAFVASGLYEEPVDPTVASQDSIFAVGMILCDGEGRLNEKSILLQSSVEHSGGQSVRVDMEKLKHYSIFPGQVVGIVGNNPSGHCLVPIEIVDTIPPSISASENLNPPKGQALEGLTLNDSSKMPTALSLMIASGPFTTSDNLYFEPLSELLAYATRKQPQLLILLGPFVDSEHPEIKKGALDRGYDDVFQQDILRRLQDHVDYMGSATRILLVPSIRDANHDFVFPQPPFDINPVDFKDQISSLSNPGIFSSNEVKIGCSTVDILRHLGAEEISRHPKDGSYGDRLSRLATHIIRQRSFYPMYPPAEGVPLDSSVAPEALDLPSIPHILILPSDLAPFVKVLSVQRKSEGDEMVKCIGVNPGRIAKGIGGGTFVEIDYYGSPDTMLASIIRI